jgi:hypothetical protein
MQQKTVLTKEFSKREVSRMRNLLMGKTGDRTQVSSGYEKKSEDRDEGDSWEENGKTWTVKNGIKQTVTKFDRLKSLVHLPIVCQKCKKAMKDTNVNRKMYPIHHMCFDCVIDMEHEIRKEGRWDEYEQSMANANKDSSLVDFENALEAWYTEKESFISEEGVVESWTEGNKSELYKEIKDWIKEMKTKDIYNSNKNE